jgi:hypothetical protein
VQQVIVDKVLSTHGLIGIRRPHVFHKIRQHAVVRNTVNVVIPNSSPGLAPGLHWQERIVGILGIVGVAYLAG